MRRKYITLTITLPIGIYRYTYNTEPLSLLAVVPNCIRFKFDTVFIKKIIFIFNVPLNYIQYKLSFNHLIGMYRI